MKTQYITLALMWFAACPLRVESGAQGETPSSAGEYLVVNLSAGPTAANYQVSELAGVPSGGWTDEYKTTKLVLRRIPAGTFVMGAPAGELGRGGYEPQHTVILTQPFYIGIFEVTQKQWERVTGIWPSYFTNTGYRDSRPVDTVAYNDIRGSGAGTNWPANGKVDADSFIGRLRERTEKAFDLPTEAQWEYAGRAGTTTALNSGKDLTAPYNCPNMCEVGRCLDNRGSGATQDEDTSVGTAKVGSHLPNAWGLYDIHGNVFEWCLDWWDRYETHPGATSDPKGGVCRLGAARVLRGGSRGQNAECCRVAARCHNSPAYAGISYGFRVALPIGGERGE